MTDAEYIKQLEADATWLRAMWDLEIARTKELQAALEQSQAQEKQTALTLDGFLGDIEKARNARVPLELKCPKCDMIHVDQDEWAHEIAHRKHLCHGCGNLWKPYPVGTVGVDVHAPCRAHLVTLQTTLDEAWLVATRGDDITKQRNEAIIEQLRADNARLDHDLAWTRAQWREAGTEIEALLKRRDELLELVAKISQTTPLESEVAEALNQRGALLAEVGTLKARIVELESMLSPQLGERP